MTSAAVRPVVQAHDVQIGNVRIPIGCIETTHIYRKDYAGKEVHEVRVWTAGGMGIKGKSVIIDFQLQTVERTNQFFQDLLTKAKASFSLCASSIKPNLVASSDGVKGVIEIQFHENHHCEEFDSAIAPVFFPGFQRQVLNGNTLKLTSADGKANQMIEIMNKSFKALNEQTYFQTAELLHKNKDFRFYAERQQKVNINCLPHRNPHYFVGLDGKVQKEIAHYGELPAGHVKRWDETNAFYYAPELLEQPAENEIAKMKASIPFLIEYANAISKISSRLAHEMSPFIEELEKVEPRNAVEWEVLFNLMKSDLYHLTEKEEAACQKISDEFEKKLKQIIGDD